jgi:hypothetical protein
MGAAGTRRGLLKAFVAGLGALALHSSLPSPGLSQAACGAGFPACPEGQVCGNVPAAGGGFQLVCCPEADACGNENQFGMVNSCCAAPDVCDSSLCWTPCGSSYCLRSLETCISGACCPFYRVCESGASTVCCPSGMACPGGVCCPSSEVCGGSCGCPTGQDCFDGVDLCTGAPGAACCQPGQVLCNGAAPQGIARSTSDLGQAASAVRRRRPARDVGHSAGAKTAAQPARRTTRYAAAPQTTGTAAHAPVARAGICAFPMAAIRRQPRTPVRRTRVTPRPVASPLWRYTACARPRGRQAAASTTSRTRDCVIRWDATARGTRRRPRQGVRL